MSDANKLFLFKTAMMMVGSGIQADKVTPKEAAEVMLQVLANTVAWGWKGDMQAAMVEEICRMLPGLVDQSSLTAMAAAWPANDEEGGEHGLH